MENQSKLKILIKEKSNDEFHTKKDVSTEKDYDNYLDFAKKTGDEDYAYSSTLPVYKWLKANKENMTKDRVEAFIKKLYGSSDMNDRNKYAVRSHARDLKIKGY